MSFLEVTEADFRRIMDINGLGVLIGTQEAARQMIAQGGGGKIINTDPSPANKAIPCLPLLRVEVCRGRTDPGRRTGACRTSDHCELLCPGRVWLRNSGSSSTRIHGSWPDREAGAGDQRVLAIHRAWPRFNARGFDRVDTVSRLVLSDYMTGQTLMIDGGMVLT